MNKLKKLFIFTLITGFAYSVNAQTGSANATLAVVANATIITPISVTQTTPMEFGSIATSGAGGTVVLSTASVLSSTGSAQHGMNGATASAAVIAVAGEAGEAFKLEVSQATALTTLTGTGTKTMTLSAFTASYNGGASASVGTGGSGTINNAIPVGGTVNVQLGATLTTVTNQAVGAYVGAITVLVSYE